MRIAHYAGQQSVILNMTGKKAQKQRPSFAKKPAAGYAKNATPILRRSFTGGFLKYRRKPDAGVILNAINQRKAKAHGKSYDFPCAFALRWFIAFNITPASGFRRYFRKPPVKLRRKIGVAFFAYPAAGFFAKEGLCFWAFFPVIFRITDCCPA